MEENTLSVLKIAPGQYPQQVEIDNDLKTLQQAVGGSIGASYPFEDPVAIVYNDDGKLMGLPLNRALRDEDGQMYDAVAGTFLVVGLGEEDFASLTPEMAQKYERLFHQPEDFIRLGHRMMVVRVPDEAVCPEESKTTPPKDAGFDRYAKRYHIDYAIQKDLSCTPPRYLIFFKAQDTDALNAAFKEYSASVLSKTERPSVLAKLHNLAQTIANLPDKVRHKEEERGL